MIGAPALHLKRATVRVKVGRNFRDLSLLSEVTGCAEVHDRFAGKPHGVKMDWNAPEIPPEVER